MCDFGFIISTSCRTNIHYNQLKRCVESIKLFHPNNNIIIINETNLSNKYKNNVIEYGNKYKNVTVINSIVDGSADQQVCKILLGTDLFSTAVYMQDSMCLNKKLINVENIDLQFIWHFTNHRIHWDMIKEPKSSYNNINNINTHTDLIKHNVLRDYNDDPNFINYVIHKLNNKNEWCGCFGSACILSKNALITMNNKVNFVDKLVQSITNRDRRANESIFALICHYSFPNKNFELSYDGLYYDGYSHGKNSMNNKNTEFDNLKWCCVREYFSKIAFNRQ